MEIPRGRGVSKAQFCGKKYDTKMEFLKGWGVQLKTFRGRGMDIFWNNTLKLTYRSIHLELLFFYPVTLLAS